uniref:Uncharacterized protein n=1 Tax=Sphaerodactylus townsendi TaxID=933632 RepID=A0ACB8EWN9_9SAUR
MRTITRVRRYEMLKEHEGRRPVPHWMRQKLWRDTNSHACLDEQGSYILFTKETVGRNTSLRLKSKLQRFEAELMAQEVELGPGKLCSKWNRGNLSRSPSKDTRLDQGTRRFHLIPHPGESDHACPTERAEPSQNQQHS